MKKNKNKKLKVAVIREELVELTGDAIAALILNQAILAHESTVNMDETWKQQIEFLKSQGQHEAAKLLKENCRNGWFYKSPNDFYKEIMISSRTTVIRRLDHLTENGWMEKGGQFFREEYVNGQLVESTWWRVNIEKIRKDLAKLGYALNGYEIWTEQEQSAETFVPPVHCEQGGVHCEQGGVHGEQGGVHGEHQHRLLHRLLTKTTNIDLSSSSSSSDEVNSKKMAVEEIDNMLREKYNHIPQEEFEEIKFEVLTDERAIIKTIKQYQGLFEYRLKEWKPKNKKENNSVKQAKNKYRSKKQGRSEIIPEWFEKYKSESEEREKKAKKMLDEAFNLEVKEDSIDFEEERRKILMKLGIIEA